MSAPVLAKEQVAAVQRFGTDFHHEATVDEGMVLGHWHMGRALTLGDVFDSHEALRAEMEAVRSDRDSLWTTVNEVKAEREAALAEVARMRPVVDAALAMKDCRDQAPRIGNPDNAAQARRADNDRVLDKFYFAVQVYREQAAKEVRP